jgi:epoxide hydrolase A/B
LYVAVVEHHRIATNGIELHVAAAGDGPPVILAHGFPELWFSWRHQIAALADAGLRALAPDMRGYGASARPADVAAYDVVTIAADLLGLLDAVGEPRAVFVGHDWGAMVAWHIALAHPERVAGVAALSVPFVAPGRIPPMAALRAHLGEDFYICWFQEPGVADAALARDVRRTLTTREVWDAAWAQRHDEPPTPRFMTEDDLAVYVEAYERTGFTGGLNWYRNLDRNWEIAGRYADRTIDQPALFLTGSRDPVMRFAPPSVMDGYVTDLEVVVVEGAGHWVQQQRPDEVNTALLDFLTRTCT